MKQQILDDSISVYNMVYYLSPLLRSTVQKTKSFQNTTALAVPEKNNNIWEEKKGKKKIGKSVFTSEWEQ